MSHDPELWFYENAIAIETSKFLDPENVNEADKAMDEIKNGIKAQDELQEMVYVEKEKISNLNEDVLSRIKLRIHPDKIQKPRKEVVQPVEFDLIWTQLASYLEESEMKIEKVIPISYGRQIRIRAEVYWAEINIFFGKRGFSVVPTTKTGSNPMLAKIAHEILLQFFNQY